MSNADTIELNGKLYDIRSGELASQLNDIQASPLKDADSVEKEFYAHQKDLPPSISETDIHVYHTDEVGSTIKVRRVGKNHSVALHAAHHKRQHTKTLLRSAVKKPSLAVHKQVIKAQGLIDTRGLHHDVISPRVVNHNAARLARSHEVSRSHMVSKFQDVITAKPHPISHEPVHHQAAASHAHHTHHAEETISEPSPLHTAVKTAPKRTVQQRSAQWAIIIAVFAVIAGIVFYIDRPQLSLGLASYHSNVSASFPSYALAGYRLQEPVQSTAGQVTMTYSSGAASYQITQSNSTWSNSDLLNSYVAPKHTPYQVASRGGLTVYVFSNISAVWVNNGIFYQLNSNNPLGTSDIVQLANSFSY